MYVKGDMGLGQGEIIFVLTGEGNWDKLKMVLYLCLQENGTGVKKIWYVQEKSIGAR